MKRVSIVGSAGRKDDKPKMTAKLYENMQIHLAKILKTIGNDIELISGGAAWADHLAVDAYRFNCGKHLTLHFPTHFIDGEFVPNNTGKTANYYHKIFSKIIGRNTLQDIENAICHGAKSFTHKGFKQRNLHVGKTDMLIAFTFGSVSGTYTKENKTWHNGNSLKPGGTFHTWCNSNAPIKIHISLQDLSYV